MHTRPDSTLHDTHITSTKTKESIISLPPHGVQLETHRGLPSTPLTPPIILFINRQFIPLPSIKDIIIHEGLYGWNVRYYLAVICTTSAGGTGGTGTNEEERRRIATRVVFEVHTHDCLTPNESSLTSFSFSFSSFLVVGLVPQNILPKFPILKEVYLKLRKDLLPN